VWRENESSLFDWLRARVRRRDVAAPALPKKLHPEATLPQKIAAPNPDAAALETFFRTAVPHSEV
jgi:hypothetical protein